MLARRTLHERFAEARRCTDELFALLTPAGLLERAVAERHRFIFYVGHLEAFDWNLIAQRCAQQPSRNAHFEKLFAFGIDPLDDGLPRDTPEDWPALDVLRPWIDQTRADVDAALESTPFDGWLENGWAANLAIEHRLMHAETLSYLLNRLPYAFKVSRQTRSPLAAPTPSAERISIPSGRATLGLERAQRSIGWDNEFDAHAVDVAGFDVDSLPVTNGDYLAFVEAGGYRDRALWSDAAWAWLQRADITHPAFWERRADTWHWRAMFESVPLPHAWPVYVSHAEATAYARWKGARLMTEPEWHRAAEGATPHANVNFAHGEPLPVGSSPASRSTFGVEELIGNGWEWTSTPFAPFAGFEALPFYAGYSADFFDGRHFVLKGGSGATHATFLRRSFRNWFQPHYPYVFAKFRCVHG